MPTAAAPVVDATAAAATVDADARADALDAAAVARIPAPGVPAPRSRRMRTALGALGATALLAATFALYLRPGLTLDLGQLMTLCGFR